MHTPMAIAADADCCHAHTYWLAARAGLHGMLLSCIQLLFQALD
jgi:hypothetical protein